MKDLQREREAFTKKLKASIYLLVPPKYLYISRGFGLCAVCKIALFPGSHCFLLHGKSRGLGVKGEGPGFEGGGAWDMGLHMTRAVYKLLLKDI